MRFALFPHRSADGEEQRHHPQHPAGPRPPDPAARRVRVGLAGPLREGAAAHGGPPLPVDDREAADGDPADAPDDRGHRRQGAAPVRLQAPHHAQVRRIGPRSRYRALLPALTHPLYGRFSRFRRRIRNIFVEACCRLDLSKDGQGAWCAERARDRATEPRDCRRQCIDGHTLTCFSIYKN